MRLVIRALALSIAVLAAFALWFWEPFLWLSACDLNPPGGHPAADLGLLETGELNEVQALMVDQILGSWGHEEMITAQCAGGPLRHCGTRDIPGAEGSASVDLLPFHSAMFFLLMGVTGSGKTTVGSLLAAALDWPFYDADGFHPEANISKMASGVPLSDVDREPWLQELRALIADRTSKGENGVLACSALKAHYRELLSSPGDVVTIYLKADRALIEGRLADRPAHYMRSSLIESQFETLEEPKDAITVPADWAPGRIVGHIRSVLGV